MKLLILFASISIFSNAETTSEALIPEAYRKLPLGRHMTNSQLAVTAEGNIRLSPNLYRFDRGQIESTESNQDLAYRLLVQDQTIGNTTVQTVTELSAKSLGNEGMELKVLTATYSDNLVRSITTCMGAQTEGVLRDIHRLDCVTASQRFCDTISASLVDSDKNKGTKFAKDPELDQKLKMCTELMEPLGAAAYRASLAFSGNVEKHREAVIDQDHKRISEQVASFQKRGWFKNKVRINSKSEPFFLKDIQSNFSNSANSMVMMGQLIQNCRQFPSNKDRGALRAVKTPAGQAQ